MRTVRNLSMLVFFVTIWLASTPAARAMSYGCGDLYPEYCWLDNTAANCYDVDSSGLRAGDRNYIYGFFTDGCTPSYLSCADSLPGWCDAMFNACEDVCDGVPVYWDCDDSQDCNANCLCYYPR